MEPPNSLPGLGRPALSTLLTLNLAKQAAMAGLPALLHDTSPNLVFLQEVSPSAQLLPLATSRGYTCHFSTSTAAPKRTIAVLANVPVTISEGRPGYLLEVSHGGHTFINVHAPSGTSGAQLRDREALFGRLAARCRSSPPLPVLVGDFNAIIHQQDAEANAAQRSSPALLGLVNNFC